ncbi:MAG: cupin domain-containing protein [Christensenellaceae bacterium]|nr:cupin domain-containing protein [Christensenellaceae bacterium]
MAGKAFVRRAEDVAPVQRADHPRFGFKKRTVVGKEDTDNLDVSVYEVPPGKSAYPYHYHLGNEEVFFILSGTGLLKTPEGERTVSAGDFIYFPNNEAGAHKITNVSESEPLVYVDFDILHEPEVVFYPDSGKVGILGKGHRLIFRQSETVDYYEGE